MDDNLHSETCNSCHQVEKILVEPHFQDKVIFSKALKVRGFQEVENVHFIDGVCIGIDPGEKIQENIMMFLRVL